MSDDFGMEVVKNEGSVEFDSTEVNKSISENEEIETGEDGWEHFSLQDLCQIGGGSTPSKSNSDYWDGGEILWTTPKDFDGPWMDDTEEKITEEGAEAASSNIYPEDTTLLVVRSGVLRHTLPVAKARKRTTVNQDLKALQPSADKVHPEYFFQAISGLSEDIRGSCKKTGTTVESIQTSLLEQYKLPVPPLPEQRKIASVLYAVDQAIQKTEAIIEQAKRVKRGLMQDLFGKAGNSHSGWGGKELWIGPKKFEVPEHWEKTKIEEIGRVVTGDTPSTDDENNFGGSLPFVTPSDLKQTKYVAETDRTLSTQGRGQAKPIPEGSVMMDCIGSDMGKVAIAGREVATNQQINSMVVTDDEYNAEFLYYHLLILSGYVKAQAGRTATPIVNKGDFQTFGLLKPPLEEQQRIAKSLATYDEVDSTNRGYLERLTSLKKGLMQDLLTGEVRTADKAIEVLDEVAAHG